MASLTPISTCNCNKTTTDVAADTSSTNNADGICTITASATASTTVCSNAVSSSLTNPPSNQTTNETTTPVNIDCCNSHEEIKVRDYLNAFLPTHTTKQNNANDTEKKDDSTNEPFTRVECCGTSQSLYCKDCCRLLVPDALLPVPIFLRKQRNNEGTNNAILESNQRPLQLPFDLHIVLDDRRGAATGLHAVTLLDGGSGLRAGGSNSNFFRQEMISIEENKSDKAGGNFSASSTPNGTKTDSQNAIPINEFSKLDINTPDIKMRSVTLIDVPRGDVIPNYSKLNHPKTKSNTPADQIHSPLEQCTNDSAFLLFPCAGESVPIESVADKIQTLVVLDCKWTKSHLSKCKELASLQKVHLTSPPHQSYFWRWHNAGPGMMSTIEAIYYAALETFQQKQKQVSYSGSSSDSTKLAIDQKNIIHLLWLFGHQRIAAYKGAQKEGKPPPWSTEGKEIQRAMRKQKGTWKQLRDKEVGKILKDECRRKKRMSAGASDDSDIM